MNNLPNCPQCGSDLTYEDAKLYICPECAHEWSKEYLEPLDGKQELSVKDAYGNILKDGDSVTIIKDIKVKGTSSVIKVGVKVKDIRLVEESNGHNIDAKIKGFGPMMLKSEFVKKCSD